MFGFTNAAELQACSPELDLDIRELPQIGRGHSLHCPFGMSRFPDARLSHGERNGAGITRPV
jgi:hypothetical protein